MSGFGPIYRAASEVKLEFASSSEELEIVRKTYDSDAKLPRSYTPPHTTAVRSARRSPIQTRLNLDPRFEQ